MSLSTHPQSDTDNGFSLAPGHILTGPAVYIEGGSVEPEAERTYSLDQALGMRQIPMENHEFVRRFCVALGIDRFEITGSYIKGLRPNGGPALNICSGYTNGFLSQREVAEATGAIDSVWPSQRGKDQWGVTHPVYGHESAGGARGKSEAELVICESCYLSLPTSGVCDNCDEG
jgi:hypothetical protein